LKWKRLRFGEGFRVALGNRRSQAAEMVVKPGKGEGDPHNRHRGADQWLFVGTTARERSFRAGAAEGAAR
jgi:hypothetical protein